MKLRICIVAPSLDILGGQSRQAVRLLTGLREEPSLQVDFIPHNPRLPRVFRWLQKIKYVRTVVTSLLYWAILLVRVPRYEIVHVFSAAYFSYLLSVLPVILIAKGYRKKVILNYHSGEAEDHLARWRLSTVRGIALTDAVIVPSEYLVNVFGRFGVSARAIANHVEVDRFRFRERRCLRPHFLSTRLLEPLYNVGAVLRAFALIQQRYPEARLTVAADGRQRGQLKRLAEDLELRNTEFLGSVPFARMPSLYDAADIYLTATDVDNMPLSILECFASGLPIVTTDAGGIPYLVTHEETGLIVPRGDHVALAACALRLLEDTALAAKITRQGRNECARYTWEAVRHQWLAVYTALSGETRRSPDAAVAESRR